MRRKFTVYGLRFSKTSVWNHINTGFQDPAVATVLTACGIETRYNSEEIFSAQLQQYLPLAVLKRNVYMFIISRTILSCNSTYRLRY